MVMGDYTIEATRAIVEARLREAGEVRLVNGFRVRAMLPISVILTTLMAFL